MAKYTRFDPRNRKYGRNKINSINRDIRIKDAIDHKPNKYDDRIEWIDEDNKEENA